ncbi:MAG TPA: hypothetical protein VFV93_10885 [Thermomicrobiales bacterium]|nr:hypothetical protein [Thermomicrobiales bacterium]
MPVKDTAREATIAAIRAARIEVTRACRDIETDSGKAERLNELLAGHGFEVSSGVAGIADASRADRKHLDRAAMRNGLRHGHIAYLVDLDSPTSLGSATVLAAAIGCGVALESEHGLVTVITYPGDAALLAIANAGVFDEFDAVFGARPAETGAGFAYTINSTGDTLASRSADITVERDATAFLAQLEAETAQHDAPSRIDGSIEDGFVRLTLTARTSVELRDLSAIVQRLAAETPGASVSFGNPTDDMLVSRILARRVKTYADTLGYTFEQVAKLDPEPATGWGNVSQVTPAFRLSFPFTTDQVVNGDPAFAAAAARSTSYDRALEFGECLGLAGLDALRDMQFRAIADDQLIKALAARGVNRQHRRWLGVHPVIKDTNEKANGKKKGPRLADFRMVRGPGMRDN